MAVTKVTELFTDRGGNETIVQGLRVTRAFQVFVDNWEDNAAIVLSSAQIPYLRAANPSAPWLFVSQRSAVPETKQPHIWRVVVTYTAPQDDNGGGAEAASRDPLDIPAQISYGFTQYNEAVEQCYNRRTVGGSWRKTEGNDDVLDVPVTNSAGVPFDPGLMDVHSNRLIRIVRNESTTQYDPDATEGYKDTVNRTRVRIGGVNIEPYQGRMRSIGAERRFFEGNAYFEVTYEIEVRRKTWTRIVLDLGFYELVGGADGEEDEELTRILDGNGKPVEEPHKLNGNGQKALSDVGAGSEGSSDDKIPSSYIEFKTRVALLWSPLRLPSKSVDV